MRPLNAYAAAAPLHAERWLTRLFEAISGLGTLPIRGRVIPEAKELAFPARHLLFGKENGVYRIIFHVQKDEQHMRVLRIWHASRDAITSADVEE